MKFDLPPLDPTNRAYLESVMRAREAQIRERAAAGLCTECGRPLEDAHGCGNSVDCFEGLVAAKRREKAGQ